MIFEAFIYDKTVEYSLYWEQFDLIDLLTTAKLTSFYKKHTKQIRDAYGELGSYFMFRFLIHLDDYMNEFISSLNDSREMLIESGTTNLDIKFEEYWNEQKSKLIKFFNNTDGNVTSSMEILQKRMNNFLTTYEKHELKWLELTNTDI